MKACSYSVHLSQHSPLSKEQGLSGVHVNEIEVRAPGLF